VLSLSDSAEFASTILLLKLFENRFINFENRFDNTMKKLAISVEEEKEGALDVKPGCCGEVPGVAVEKTGGGGGSAGLTRAGARQIDTIALSSACTTSREMSLPGEAEQGLLNILATGRDFEQANMKDDKTRKLEERIRELETQVSRLEHDVQSRDGRIVELEEFVAGVCNKAQKLCKEKENPV
jgi:hypothetical protein